MTQTENPNRVNANYRIVDSIHVGEAEFVLGVHTVRANMYVTWRCNQGENYYWGHYYTDELAAKRDLLQRAQEELEREEYRQGKSSRETELER